MLETILLPIARPSNERERPKSSGTPPISLNNEVAFRASRFLIPMDFAVSRRTSRYGLMYFQGK